MALCPVTSIWSCIKAWCAIAICCLQDFTCLCPKVVVKQSYLPTCHCLVVTIAIRTNSDRFNYPGANIDCSLISHGCPRFQLQFWHFPHRLVSPKRQLSVKQVCAALTRTSRLAISLTSSGSTNFVIMVQYWWHVVMFFLSFLLHWTNADALSDPTYTTHYFRLRFSCSSAWPTPKPQIGIPLLFTLTFPWLRCSHI